jgi:serine/threonine-protein kinase
MKNNGEIVPFLKQKDYIMLNNALGSGSFGKTVLLKTPFIEEIFVAQKYEPDSEDDKETFYKNFLYIYREGRYTSNKVVVAGVDILF